MEEYAIRFDEVRYSNDVMFNTIVGSKARTVRVVNRPLYVLTERSGSLTAGFARKPGELQVRAEVTLRAQKLMNECGYSHPITPFSDYLRAMVHRDRRLFLEYFTRIPEVYDSYWQPLREMAAERAPVRLFAICLLPGIFGKALPECDRGDEEVPEEHQLAEGVESSAPDELAKDEWPFLPFEPTKAGCFPDFFVDGVTVREQSLYMPQEHVLPFGRESFRECFQKRIVGYIVIG